MKKRAEQIDFTETFLSIIFPQILPSGRIDILTIAILGSPSCGKSTLMEWIANIGSEMYGDNANIIYANGYRVAESAMDDRPLQMLFLDDISGQASAFKGGNADAIQINNTLRHKLEDKQIVGGHQFNGGMVLVFKAWQRDNDLHRAFKQDDFRIYKTAPVLTDERNELIDEIGEIYVKRLEDITYKIRIRRDQSAKSECVCVMSSVGKNGGVGILKYEESGFKFPRIRDEKEFVKSKEKEEKELNKEEKKEAKAPARPRVCDEAVIALHREGRSEREIAKLLGIAPSTVHRKIAACECTKDGNGA